MATNTTKLGLIKPDFTDVVDITDLNNNADDIDAAVGATIVTSTTRPTAPWTGQIIHETDTDKTLVWDGVAWVETGTAVEDLDDLGDVDLTGVESGDALVYNGSDWVNAALNNNAIINGDFSVNQRGFTSTTTTATYGFDRWVVTAVDGTTTYSSQAFTPGAAPVAGYESTNFARLVSSGQTLATAQSNLQQRIEDVRTFAGQTVTISFWAKASTGTPNVAVNFSQNFGSGGSSAVNVNGQKFAITSSWARYSRTFSIPSVSGQTIGAGSFLRTILWISAGSNNDTPTDSIGIQSVTVDFWGVQVEAGPVATQFKLAGGGSKAAELALCQRYYWRNTPGVVFGGHGPGIANSTTGASFFIALPIPFRAIPTSIEFSSIAAVAPGVAVYPASTLAIGAGTGLYVLELIAGGMSGLTQSRAHFLINNNNSAGFIALSAEL